MQKNTILLIIFLNLLIVSVEIGVGYKSNSTSLIVDAFHNLGDVLAVTVSFVAIVFTAKSATDWMTFGYIRAEMMAGFVNSAFLCITMGVLFYEAIEKLLNPMPVASINVAITAFVALIANGVSAYLLHKNGLDHSHEHTNGCCSHAHNNNDLNIKSAYLHMLGDAIISFGVVVGSLAGYYFGTFIIDPLLSVVFCVYIFVQSFGVLKKTFFSLMDANDNDISQIINELTGFSEVDGVHDIHLYSPSSKEKFFSAHLVFKENRPLDEIENTLEKIRHILEHKGITHTILQPETIKYAQEHHLCTTH